MTDLNNFEINIISTRADEISKNLAGFKGKYAFNGEIHSYDLTVVDLLHGDLNLDFSNYLGEVLCFSSVHEKKRTKEILTRFRPDFFSYVEFDQLKGVISEWLVFLSETETKWTEKKSYNELISEVITNSTQINEVIQKVENECRFGADHLEERFTSICWELLQNAFYNAPIDDVGNPLFNSIDLDSELEGLKEVFFKVFEVDDEIFIQVKDQYGSLTPETIKNFLYRDLVTIRKTEERGAGIGLNMIQNKCTSFLVVIDSFQSCLFTISFKKTVRNKDFLTSKKVTFIKENL